MPIRPTATTSRRASASPGRSAATPARAHHGPRPGRQRAARWLHAGLRAARNGRFRDSDRRQSRHLPDREPQPQPRQPGHPGHDPLAQPCEPRTTAVRHDSRLPDDGRRHRRHHDLPTRPAGAVLPDVDRGLAAQAHRRPRLEVRYVGTRRSRAGRPTTTTRSTSSRTDSSTNSARRSGTSRRTSPRGAATRSPIRARLEPRRCRYSSPISTGWARRRPAALRRTRVRAGPAQPSSVPRGRGIQTRSQWSRTRPTRRAPA